MAKKPLRLYLKITLLPRPSERVVQAATVQLLEGEDGPQTLILQGTLPPAFAEEVAENLGLRVVREGGGGCHQTK